MSKECTSHLWTYHTYAIDGNITSKKLCFYCKKVEEVSS